jgi:quinol monooxygenase YgiN
VIIIAGRLDVDPNLREEYLRRCGVATARARTEPGCLDFVQAADPFEPGRINVFERWASDEDLAAFRSGEWDMEELPEVLAADVAKYRVASVEAP